MVTSASLHDCPPSLATCQHYLGTEEFRAAMSSRLDPLSPNLPLLSRCFLHSMDWSSRPKQIDNLQILHLGLLLCFTCSRLGSRRFICEVKAQACAPKTHRRRHTLFITLCTHAAPFILMSRSESAALHYVRAQSAAC
jgi:hypothetical protein